MKELEGTKSGGETAISAAEIEALEPRGSGPEVLDGDPAELVLAAGSLPAADRHPALVYLASLSAEESRRTMRQALDKIAAFDFEGLPTYWQDSLSVLSLHKARKLGDENLQRRTLERIGEATYRRLLSTNPLSTVR